MLPLHCFVCRHFGNVALNDGVYPTDVTWQSHVTPSRSPPWHRPFRNFGRFISGEATALAVIASLLAQSTPPPCQSFPSFGSWKHHFCPGGLDVQPHCQLVSNVKYCRKISYDASATQLVHSSISKCNCFSFKHNLGILPTAVKRLHMSSSHGWLEQE